MHQRELKPTPMVCVEHYLSIQNKYQSIDTNFSKFTLDKQGEMANNNVEEKDS